MRVTHLDNETVPTVAPSPRMLLLQLVHGRVNAAAENYLGRSIWLTMLFHLLSSEACVCGRELQQARRRPSLDRRVWLRFLLQAIVSPSVCMVCQPCHLKLLRACTSLTVKKVSQM